MNLHVSGKMALAAALLVTPAAPGASMPEMAVRGSPGTNLQRGGQTGLAREHLAQAGALAAEVNGAFQ